MDNVDKLIYFLIAIQNFAKDIHYSCKGEGFYGKHLLADRIYDGLDDFIDQLKETCYLGNNVLPLPSGEYLTHATNFLPKLEADDITNFKAMQNLLINCLVHLQSMLSVANTARGEASLFDGIAQDLQQKLGLVNLQVKD